MAKTFGTGADPKGLVNRGVEGSGAAQIFRPSQAVQDFVTGQRQQGVQKQKQKQAEAKAKAERQKEIDKYTVDLVTETFMQPDNEKSLAMFSEIQTELAKLKMQGVDPRTQPEFQKKVYEAKQFNNIIKNQREDYNKALNNLNAISKDANYTPEQIDDFTARLQAYTVAEPDARFSIDISTPLKEVPINTTKAIREGKGLINTVTKEDPSQRTVTLVGHRQAAEQVASDPKFVKTYSAQHGIKGATPEETKKLVTDKVEEILKLGGTLKEKTTFAVGKTGKTQPQLDQNFNQWLDALRNDDLNAKSFPMEEGGTKIAVGNSTMTISGVKLDNTNLHTVVTPDGLQSVTGDYEAGITVSLKGKTVSETITEIVDGKEVERIVYKDLNEKIFIPFSDMESLKNLYYNKVNADGRLFGAQKGKEVNVNIQPPKQPTAPKTVTGTPKTPSKAPRPQ